jgi:hypothetical protein
MEPNTPPIQIGSLSSPHDYRDEVASTAAVAQLASLLLPDTYQTTLDTPMMQNQIPACVSHDAVENLKVYWFGKTGQWVNFSPRFLDILAKRTDGQDRATGGTFPRLVFKLMAQYGCATTDVLSNDTTLPVLQYRDDSLLTPDVMANALQYRTPGYVAIPKDVQSTRAAIYLYGIISSLFQIGDEFWTPDWKDPDIDPLKTPQTIVGGHQLGPKGWVSATLNTLRNEWSAAWANQGEANYDPIAWAPFIIEQWAIAEIPTDIADYLSHLPAPADFHAQWNFDMQIGDMSDNVKEAQVALMILGFLTPLTPDALGHYGPMTATAVGKYQQANRIPLAPNHIGPMTRAALNKQFAV